jgi:hypothetical protein
MFALNIYFTLESFKIYVCCFLTTVVAYLVFLGAQCSSSQAVSSPWEMLARTITVYSVVWLATIKVDNI